MSKKKNKAPKRLAGVKLPKALRKPLAPVTRVAATPLGTAILAELIVDGARAALTSPEFKRAATEARQAAMRAGAALVASAQSAAQSAEAKLEAPEREPTRRKQAREELPASAH